MSTNKGVRRWKRARPPVSEVITITLLPTSLMARTRTEDKCPAHRPLQTPSLSTPPMSSPKKLPISSGRISSRKFAALCTVAWIRLRRLRFRKRFWKTIRVYRLRSASTSVNRLEGRRAALRGPTSCLPSKVRHCVIGRIRATLILILILSTWMSRKSSTRKICNIFKTARSASFPRKGWKPRLCAKCFPAMGQVNPCTLAPVLWSEAIIPMICLASFLFQKT